MTCVCALGSGDGFTSGLVDLGKITNIKGVVSNLYVMWQNLVNQFDTHFESADCLGMHKVLRLEPFKRTPEVRAAAPKKRPKKRAASSSGAAPSLERRVTASPSEPRGVTVERGVPPLRAAGRRTPSRSSTTTCPAARSSSARRRASR